MSSNFRYEIIDKDNKTFHGFASGNNSLEVANNLKQRGATIVSIEQISNKKALFYFKKNVSIQEKILLTNYLATMINSGLSITSGIDVLIQDAKSSYYCVVLEDIKSKIQKGLSLSDALSNYPNSFDKSFISIIKSGEESGKLNDVLQKLGEKLESDLELRKKIQGAALYPFLILSVLIVIGGIMLVVVVPKITSLFKDLNVPIPFLTNILLMLSDFIIHKWQFALITLISLFIIIALFIKGRYGKIFITFLIIHLPIIKKITKAIDLSRLTLSLSILLRSGVPVEKSLIISSESMINPKLRKILENSAQEIKKGTKISESLRLKQNIIPNIMIKIIEVGEETGTLEKSLDTLYKAFDNEVADRIKSFSTLIEPIMMIGVGIAVGFFVISIFGPMYQILGGMNGS